jgi:hypothetical protein
VSLRDFANAVRKIRVDLGIPIEFTDGVPIKKEAGPGSYHFAVGTIRYSAIDNNDPEQDGTLLYLKSSLTGDEPAEVTQYSKQHPDFPHESTANQWFSESQFESYRALGYHMAIDIAGDTRYLTIEDFVRKAKEKQKGIR